MRYERDWYAQIHEARKRFMVNLQASLTQTGRHSILKYTCTCITQRVV